jgi:hypothetical protein
MGAHLMSGTPTGHGMPTTTATPDQVYEALYKRDDREDPVRNQRRHPRNEWIARLTIWVKDCHDTWDTPRELKVMTRDLSRGGFSFIYDQFLHEGTVIRTQFDPLPDRPILIGVVANCRHLNGRQHRVGVQFVESEPPLD